MLNYFSQLGKLSESNTDQGISKNHSPVEKFDPNAFPLKYFIKYNICSSIVFH